MIHRAKRQMPPWIREGNKAEYEYCMRVSHTKANHPLINNESFKLGKSKMRNKFSNLLMIWSFQQPLFYFIIKAKLNV